MKNNLILIFSFVSCGFSQTDYSHSNSYPSGMNLILDSRMIEYTKKNQNNPNSAYINKLKASYERKLLNEANRRLKISIENQKKIDRNNQRAFNREMTYASSWSFSPQARHSGASWNNLSDANRQMYRERFLNYWSNTSKTESVDFHKVKRADSQKAMLEQEMSTAWARSKTGQNDGRIWKSLPQKEKDYYANNYLTRKKCGLLPNELPSIPQYKYKQAWYALKDCGSVNKPWQELSSVERSMFRKEYSESTYDHKNGLLAYK